MRKLVRNTRGAAALEFGLVSLPVILFVFGLMQTAWIVWANNLLNIAVDTAARCGAIGSQTSPCLGSTHQNMVGTATRIMGSLSGASFADNTCSGVGLVGTYTVNFLFIVDVTLTAKSCYPTVS